MQPDEFAQEFDVMFAQLARRSRYDRFVPNTDVYLDSEHRLIIVQLELAGIEPSSLRVELEERTLYIAGTREIGPHHSGGGCVLKEIESGDFERKVHLPENIEPSQASGLYRDGILTIELSLAASEAYPLVRTEIRLVIKRNVD